MTPNGFVERRKRPSGVNSGDLIHLIEIGVMIFGLGMGYQELKASSNEVNRHSQQLDRIEHYLSSKDAHYWEIVKDN